MPNLFHVRSLAGFVWDRFGVAMTFYTGVTFCLLALAGLALQPAHPTASS